MVTQQTFVLQAPAGSNPVINNASASVPFDTTLVFAPGSTLKSQNASLFVQNQGSAIQVLGGSTSSQQVNFTTYNDASIGGAVEQQSGHHASRGRLGRHRLAELRRGHRRQPGAVPGRRRSLQGINGPAISGADDGMSIINNADHPVRRRRRSLRAAAPSTAPITLFNARPAITNDNDRQQRRDPADLQAAIAADMDSFRQDDEAWGPLDPPHDIVANNSLNGIWLLSESDGFVQPIERGSAIPTIPSTLGGIQNYVFFEPLPFVDHGPAHRRPGQAR